MLLEEIADYLISLGYATELGIDIFIDGKSGKIQEAVVLYEYPGLPDGLGQTQVRSIQITRSSMSYVTARQVVEDIYKLFHKSDIIYLSEKRWCVSQARSTPTEIKEDENNNVTWGFNVGLTTYYD